MKDTRGKPNEQLFPSQVVIQLPKLNYVTYIIDMWTKVWIRTARINNSKYPQQKYRLGTVRIKIMGALTCFTGSQPRSVLNSGRLFRSI